MWVRVARVKLHWFGINWHVFNQSECRNCCLYVVIQKIAPQAKSGKNFQIWFFPRFGGKKWRRSEHAHASYPGLFFPSPGFSPYMGREERRVKRESDLFITSMITDRISNDTKSYYQLTIKITIPEKRVAKVWMKGKIRIKILTKEM